MALTFDDVKQMILANDKTDTDLPLFGKSDGENVIIELHKTDGVKFYRLTYPQKNGWLRVVTLYENGDVCEEHIKN